MRTYGEAIESAPDMRIAYEDEKLSDQIYKDFNYYADQVGFYFWMLVCIGVMVVGMFYAG